MWSLLCHTYRILFYCLQELFVVYQILYMGFLFHRITEWLRLVGSSEGHLVQSLCKQERLEQGAQDHVQQAFEDLQGGRPVVLFFICLFVFGFHYRHLSDNVVLCGLPLIAKWDLRWLIFPCLGTSKILCKIIWTTTCKEGYSIFESSFSFGWEMPYFSKSWWSSPSF